MKRYNIFLGVIYIIILYVYLHNPILPNGMGSCKLLYVPAFLFILFNFKEFFYYISRFKTECVLLVLLIFYSLIEFLSSGEFSTTRLHIVGFVEYFILPFFIMSWVPKIGSNNIKSNFIRFMLITASVGAIITVGCVLVPSFNEFVRSSVNNLIYEAMDEYRSNVVYRGFGISEVLTYSYGIIQGMFFVLCLFYYKENKWVLPLSFFIILSAALNARTGLVVAAFGFLLFFIKSKKSISFFVVIIAFLVVVLNIVPILELLGVSTKTVDWLALFFEEAGSIFSSHSMLASDTTSYMFSDMLVWPRDLAEWIAGCGYDIYWSSGRRSDLGWVIQLNYGGLLYMVLELSLLFYMYKRLKKTGYGTLALFLAFAFIISNIKGPALPNSGIFRFIMLIYLFFILQEQVNIDSKSIRKKNPKKSIVAI